MRTIMIADDSPTMREILSTLLKQSGFQVIEAENGFDAQQKFQVSFPDLLITDIVMPQMDGYTLCRWVKETYSEQKLPVIMCTVKNQVFDQHWGLKQGGDAYITKPFAPAELLKAVKRLLKIPNSSIN